VLLLMFALRSLNGVSRLAQRAYASSTAGQVINCKAAVAWEAKKPLCKVFSVVLPHCMPMALLDLLFLVCGLRCAPSSARTSVSLLRWMFCVLFYSN
jgi:hypothetical protein